MRSIVKTVGAALALSATVLVASAPADAERWRGGYRGGGYGYRGGGYGYGYRGGDRAGLALGAGLLGLGLGAAIASRPAYGYGYGYAPPPPPPGYGYDYYDYAPRCTVERRWDGWRGRYVSVRYCD